MRRLDIALRRHYADKRLLPALLMPLITTPAAAARRYAVVVDYAPRHDMLTRYVARHADDAYMPLILYATRHCHALPPPRCRRR